MHTNRALNRVIIRLIHASGSERVPSPRSQWPSDEDHRLRHRDRPLGKLVRGPRVKTGTT